MARFTSTITVVALLGLLPTFVGPASANLITVPIFLDGTQEVPPIDTPGTGTGTVSYDPVTRMLTADITFENLVSPATVAHFHGSATSVPGVNAGALIDLDVETDVGGTSGTVTGGGILTTTWEEWLFDDLLYVNIHSQLHGPGEIRGQVSGIPEPSSLVLVSLAAIGLAGLAWRRRKATAGQ